MEKNNWLLIAAAVLMTAAYVVFFSDWFQPRSVRIFHTNRNPRPRPRLAQEVSLPNLMFGLNRQFKLTEIEVVPLAEYQSNQKTLPL